MVARSTSGMSEILYSVRVFEVSKILLVTLSGAGAPLARLYLIPKSSSGPAKSVSRRVLINWLIPTLTTRVVRGGQQDTTSGLANADDVRGSRGTEDTILADDELLDTVCGTNLCNGLGDLGVPVTTVTTDDESRVLDTLGDGEENASNEGL